MFLSNKCLLLFSITLFHQLCLSPSTLLNSSSPSTLFCFIFCFLVKINGNHIRQDTNSDSESSVSSIVGTWVSPGSHSPFLTHDYMGQEVVSLTDDSDSEWVSRNSLDEKALLLDSLEALLSHGGGQKDYSEVSMPPSCFD